MVIRFLQLLFLSIQFRSAYMRLDLWYWTAKLSTRLARTACDRCESACAEIDDLLEVLNGIADQQ